MAPSTAASRLRWIAACAACALLAVLVIMTQTYAFPRQDDPGQADAIFVLGGLSSKPVTDEARRLADAGFSDRIVISDAFGGDTKPAWLCLSAADYDISCFTPNPATTAGEAHAIAEFAADNEWDSVIVVTADYHVSRARVILEQCFSGSLAVVGAPVPLDLGDWLYQFTYQTGGFLKLLAEPAC